VPTSPRVEIAPGIFAESVVRHARTVPAEPYEVYQVTGGVFDHFEVDSMSSLARLVGLLSALAGDELRAWAQEPATAGSDSDVPRAFARRAAGLSNRDRGHRRSEVVLPAPAPPAAAHRRFICDAGAPRRARIWAAETLGDCLPDTEWSVDMLERTVLQASELVAEAVVAGAAAVLLTLEIDGERLLLSRFEELRGGDLL
jgi:hypothetical protein